ncbi:hypothetical protein B8W72_03550 [Pseudomonas putida]|uniref:Uncharacterized protein n=1 Tax=Pseudomonas putida TaxID=303 RepID=A0A1Y3LNL7_PSEPU|nr:hypothetical protein [Pseudomonas putida]OUM37770.1 hypothetical protein B8W72_03550 [Pseudomonas putida]
MQYSLNRLKIKDQISHDLIKIMALGERTLLNIALTISVFFGLQKSGLAADFLVGAVCSGTLTFLAYTLKTMYYDNALSQLELPPHTDTTTIDSALYGMGYIETIKGEYSKSKAMFSILHRCKSEKIFVQRQSKALKIKGPYRELEMLIRHIS